MLSTELFSSQEVTSELTWHSTSVLVSVGHALTHVVTHSDWLKRRLRHSEGRGSRYKGIMVSQFHNPAHLGHRELRNCHRNPGWRKRLHQARGSQSQRRRRWGRRGRLIICFFLRMREVTWCYFPLLFFHSYRVLNLTDNIWNGSSSQFNLGMHNSKKSCG